MTGDHKLPGTYLRPSVCFSAIVISPICDPDIVLSYFSRKSLFPPKPFKSPALNVAIDLIPDEPVGLSEAAKDGATALGLPRTASYMIKDPRVCLRLGGR